MTDRWRDGDETRAECHRHADRRPVGDILRRFAWASSVQAAAFAWLVTFWLILVEGHIISRALELHRITGTAIAVVIFILQLGFYFSFGEFPEASVN